MMQTAISRLRTLGNFSIRRNDSFSLLSDFFSIRVSDSKYFEISSFSISTPFSLNFISEKSYKCQ